MLLPLLPALLAALAPSLPCRGWSPSSAASGSGRKETPPPELPLPPANSSASFSTAAAAVAAKSPFPTAEGALAADFPEARERATEATPGPTTSAAAEAAAPSPGPPRPAPHQQQQQQHQPPPPREDPPCNISVQRQMLSSLLVRWSPLGFQTQCDLVLFSTSGPGGRAFFSAAFHRVGPPPLLIDHVGLAAGGAQQDLRLCVGCSWARGRRVGRLRPGPPSNPPSSPSAALFSSSSSSSPSSEHGQPWQQGERLHFCCLDFSLEELKGDPGWRMNRKPIESTLVACFMTLVIIVWSVAALIWPVPIIAGFLPNGMEQRRGAATSGGAPGAGAAAK